MKKDSPLLFIIILIGLIALGIGVVMYLQNIVPDTIKSGSSANEQTKAERRCLEVVKAGLRDATRAKFSSQKVDPLGNGRFRCTGNIDAPNATGILVRGNYICVFNSSTRSFDLLSLEGGDVWTPLKK